MPDPKLDEKPKTTGPKTKLLEETGRFVCKRGVTFTDDKGKRAIAVKGDVVAMHPEDAKALFKSGAIEPEVTEA